MVQTVQTGNWKMQSTMENNVIDQKMRVKESRFRRAAVIINIIIPIFVIKYEFIYAMYLITDKKLMHRLSQESKVMPELQILDVYGVLAACTVDFVISTLFVIAVICCSKHRNFKAKMLVPTCIWATWNSLRVLLDVAKFVLTSSVPSQSGSNDSYFAVSLTSFVSKAVPISLRMLYITVIILCYKWINVANTAHQDPTDEILHQDEYLSQENGDQILLLPDPSIRSDIPIPNRPNDRQYSGLSLTTVLIAANFISLLCRVLPELPNEIASLAVYKNTNLIQNTKILSTYVVADIIETILSLFILIALWANGVKTKKAKTIVVFIWGTWHVVRVILHFSFCIWISVKITKVVRDGLHRWFIDEDAGLYFELSLWIICILFVLITAIKELKKERNNNTLQSQGRLLGMTDNE